MFIFSATTNNPPKIFGLVHFLILGLFLLLTILICVFMRKINDKQNRIILFVVGFWLLLFEILKQILLIYDSGNYQYDWQHLPLQPCSALMYSIIVLAFTCSFKKAEKFNEFLYAFIFGYGFFSGISAIIMPAAIFSTSYILLLIQTTQHHMLLALLAIYLFVSGRVRINIKTFLKALAVFVGWCFIGFILNVILFAITKNPDINMMYMGPNKIWSIPLVSDFIKFSSVRLYIPFYIFIYSAMAILSMYFIWLINKIVLLIINACNKNKTKE